MDLSWACFLVSWASREGLPWKQAWSRRIVGIFWVGMGYRMQFIVAGTENVGELNGGLRRVWA